MKFVRTPVATQHFSISKHHLYRLVQRGKLKLKHHYIIVSDAESETISYRWNLLALEEYWSMSPGRRR